MADEKKYLREILTDARNYLRFDQAIAWSSNICSRIVASLEYQRAKQVVLYSAKGNEVSTRALLGDALLSGKEVYFPRIDGQSLKLIRVRAAFELKPGRFHIDEPCGEEAIAPSDLSSAVVCIPGLAFSPIGQRLGRGGGYYDRLLAAIAPDASIFGLAYSFQLLDRLPETEIDQRVHYVFTESAVHAAPVRVALIDGLYDQQNKEVHPRVSLDGALGTGDRRNRSADREPASEPK